MDNEYEVAIANEGENFEREQQDSSSIIEEVEEISKLLDGSNSLQVEMIWSAMKYLQDNPQASIKEATDYGWNEWDK